MSIGMGDVYENFSPELAQRDVDLLIRVLGMSESEAQAVQALYDGFIGGLKNKAREASAKADKALEESQTMGDQKLARAYTNEYSEASETMTKQFLADLQSMLSGQQAGRWPIAERELRRLKRIGSGNYPGESIDVVRMLEDIDSEVVKKPEVAELLEQYAAQVDAALVARDKFIEDNKDRFAELMESDAAGAESMFVDSQRLRLQVRDINRKYVRQIGALLPEATRLKLDEAMFSRSYGFAGKPTRSESFILAASKVEGLSADAREQIEAIVKAYLPWRDEHVRRVCEEEEKVRLEARPVELMKKLGRRPMYDSDSRFSGQPPVEKDHPLQQAKRARFDNDRTTRAQVESLLTIEQRESIPNEVRGQAQFESIGASGL